MEAVNRDKFTCFFLQDAVTLCSYPFIFDAQAKTKMLQTDAELQMQVILLSLNFPAPCLFFPAFCIGACKERSSLGVSVCSISLFP